MNPQSQENTPSFDLPTPGQNEKNLPQESEQFRAPVTETQGAVAVEAGISAGQAAQAANAAASAQTGVPTAPPPIPGAGQTGTQPANTPGWMPQVADDTDLIEKEWVDKAKEIVAQTSHDPYLQNKEMNKVRADYMKKRYNKDIKLSED
jgi:hypothetical protein